MKNRVFGVLSLSVAMGVSVLSWSESAFAGPSDPCTQAQRHEMSLKFYALSVASANFFPPTPTPYVPTTVAHAHYARQLEAPYQAFIAAAGACARGTNGATPSEMNRAHRAGGFAAWGNGDIALAIERFNLGGDTVRANQFLTSYSPVHLDFRQAPTPRYLAQPGLPQTALSAVSDNSQAVNRAYRAISLVGKYHNYLPPGTYTIAGRTFEVRLNQTTTASY